MTHIKWLIKHEFKIYIQWSTGESFVWIRTEKKSDASGMNESLMMSHKLWLITVTLFQDVVDAELIEPETLSRFTNGDMSAHEVKQLVDSLKIHVEGMTH